MRRSRFLFPALVAVAALVCACGDPAAVEDTPGGNETTEEEKPSTSKNVSLKFTVSTDVETITDWRGGDLISLVEIVDGVVGTTVKPHMTVSKDKKSVTFSTSMKRCESGKSFRYAVIYPPTAVGNDGTFSIGERQTPESDSFEQGGDFIYGLSAELSKQPDGEQTSICAKRFGGIAKVTLKGIASGEHISKVMISFPCDVIGTCTFDTVTGVCATVKGKYGETAILSPNSSATGNDTFLFRTGPCSIESGSTARVNVWAGSKYYFGIATFGKAISVTENGEFAMEVSVSEIPSFSNPVTADSHPDPTVWKDGKTFYMLGTTGSQNGDLLTSTDMVHWSKLGYSPLDATDALNARYWDNADRKIATNYSAFWAPDVTKIGNKWMFYVTCYRSSVDCAIVAFSSDSPTGPFRYVGKICDYVDNQIASNIDPEVIIDPSTGKVWMFFGSTGAIHRVQLNETGTAIAEGAKYTHVAGIVKTNSDRSKVYEGVYLYYRKGYWYMFVSGGLYTNATYMMRIGRSERLEGTFVAKDGRGMSEGMGSILLSSSDTDNFYGPGHNGEIYTDDRGNDYIVYHCHSKKNDTEGKGYRYVMLQRIFWDAEGWPYFDTEKPLAVDAAPLFQ